MKLARTGTIAAAVLAVASVAFAQKPDFSGTWAPDTAAATGTTGGGGGGRGMAAPMTVKLAADTLTIERSMGENKMVSTYKLDGTESVNKRTTQQGEIEIKSVAKWDGDKLSITHKQPGRDGAIQEVTETWSLEAGNLVVERTGGRGPSKMVYKKTT
jgi:hypothetical protein